MRVYIIALSFAELLNACEASLFIDGVLLLTGVFLGLSLGIGQLQLLLPQ